MIMRRLQKQREEIEHLNKDIIEKNKEIEKWKQRVETPEKIAHDISIGKRITSYTLDAEEGSPLKETLSISNPHLTFMCEICNNQVKELRCRIDLYDGELMCPKCFTEAEEDQKETEVYKQNHPKSEYQWGFKPETTFDGKIVTMKLATDLYIDTDGLWKLSEADEIFTQLIREYPSFFELDPIKREILWTEFKTRHSNLSINGNSALETALRKKLEECDKYRKDFLKGIVELSGLSLFDRGVIIKPIEDVGGKIPITRGFYVCNICGNQFVMIAEPNVKCLKCGSINVELWKVSE
jgi:Zn finger protein HypA/HybF involved in hydrogenase expression